MFKIHGIAIVGQKNTPLYMQTSFQESVELNENLFYRNIFSLLDTIDSISKISFHHKPDPFLGLLATINTYSYYAFLSPCSLKIIITGKFEDMSKSAMVKEGVVRAKLKDIHNTWCISLLNVFIPVEKNSPYPPIDLFLEGKSLAKAD